MKSTLLFIGLLLTISCSSPKSAPADTAVATQEAAPMAAKLSTEPDQDAPAGEPTAPAPSVPVGTDRKIIRNATLDIKVADFRASAKRITALVGSFGGLISSEEESRENDRLKNQLTIRVPASRFDRFLDTLLHESVYTATKRITAEDVTKQFVDTEARIRNQKATETRYRELLKQARNVKEILEVDEQLRSIRETVEIQEAELRELKNNVAMSTIDLTFYQDTDPTTAPESPYLSRVWSNLKGGFGLIGGFFLGLAYLVPLLAIFGAIGWGISRWVRSRNQRG